MFVRRSLLSTRILDLLYPPFGAILGFHFAVDSIVALFHSPLELIFTLLNLSLEIPAVQPTPRC
jgi:hypothetical protein